MNPSLEQVSGGVPTCFSRSGWGSHTVAWSITADAHSGTRAQSVRITNYGSGDRKLIQTENATCAPAVVPGEVYDLSVWYKLTSARNSLTVFRHSGAGWTYWTELKTLPPTSAWTLASGRTPPVPSGTDQISFGISISANGTLITDDYSLAQVGPPPPPPTSELTVNPGLEQGGDPPAGWLLAGWGDATVTTSVTSDAHGGSRAYRITLSGRTQGDYKLLPTEAASPRVEPGAVYNLSVWYRSNTAQNGLTIFTHTASGWGYWADLQTLPAVADWTQAVTETPPIPAGVDAIAWGISIAGNGTLTTDDYSTTKKGVSPPPPGGPVTLGEWAVESYEMPVRSIHATVLKNSKVLLIAGSGNSLANFNAGSFKASVWDPLTGSFTTLDVPKTCSAQAMSRFPTVASSIQGGTKSYPSTPTGADYGGLRDSWIFDPDTNTFAATNGANEGHWYPTLTLLGSGDVWMAGGLKEDTTGAVNTERFSFGLRAVAADRSGASDLVLLGSVPPHDPHAGRETLLLGRPRLRERPARDGRVDLQPRRPPPSATSRASGPQGHAGPIGVGAASAGPGSGGPDHRRGQHQHRQPGHRPHGHRRSEEPEPGLRSQARTCPASGRCTSTRRSCRTGRSSSSNGSRLNRDNSTNVLSAALYDPATNTMRSVAADPIGRNYHSTAVLLPDGRVAVLGSNPGDGSFEMRISIYRPPYLFRSGVRPSRAFRARARTARTCRST